MCCGVVWYVVLRCGLLWYAMVCCGVVCCGMLWCVVVWCGVIRCGMCMVYYSIWYDVFIKGLASHGSGEKHVNAIDIGPNCIIFIFSVRLFQTRFDNRFKL